MITVYSNGKLVAMINKQDKLALGYCKEEPWLLLHNTGRTDRFASKREVRDEAVKSWPGVTFKIEGTP